MEDPRAIDYLASSLLFLTILPLTTLREGGKVKCFIIFTSPYYIQLNLFLSLQHIPTLKRSSGSFLKFTQIGNNIKLSPKLCRKCLELS